jgi:hypothetical protein
LSYYIPSKVVRETLGKVVLQMSVSDVKIDYDYLHRLISSMLAHEVFILNDKPQSIAERDR